MVSWLWCGSQAKFFGSLLLGAKLLAGILLLIYGAVLLLRPSAWPVIDIAVLIGAVGAAVIFRGSLTSYGAVVALLVTAAAVDIFSVSGGLSRGIIEGYTDGSSDLLLYLTLVIPIDGRLIPIVGISDLFIGGSAAVALLALGSGPLPSSGRSPAVFWALLFTGYGREGPGLTVYCGRRNSISFAEISRF